MKGLIPISLVAALALPPLAGAQQEGAASFLKQAAETNLAEQEMAEVAQERAARKEVKEYAEHIQQEHERANEKLQSIADKKNVELPDEPSTMHQRQKERLSKLEGQAFDQAYLKAQVEAHQKAIKTFEQQAKAAQDPEVKQYAQQNLPTLREHLKQAQMLQQQIAQQKPRSGAAGQSPGSQDDRQR